MGKQMTQFDQLLFLIFPPAIPHMSFISKINFIIFFFLYFLHCISWSFYYSSCCIITSRNMHQAIKVRKFFVS
nr:hypothetical protein Itr_chr05CG11770 [Ipomoea trifida]